MYHNLLLPAVGRVTTRSDKILKKKYCTPLRPPLVAMTSKASVFRAIAHSRKTCRRFQPGRCIPTSILQDVLQTTLVCITVVDEVQ